MSWMEAIKPGSSATLQQFSKGREMTPTPPPPDLNPMQAAYHGQMHPVQNMTPSPQLHHGQQGYIGQQGYTSPQGYIGQQPRLDLNDIPRRNKSFSDAAQRDTNVPVDLNQTWPSMTRPPLSPQPEEYMEPAKFPTTAFSNRANPGSRATISHLPRNQGPPVPPPRPVLRSRTSPKITHDTEPEEYVVMQPTSPVSPTSPLTQSPLSPSPPPHTPPPPFTPPPPQNPPPSPLRPVPRPRRDRRKENEQAVANNTVDGGYSISDEPEVDAHNYVTLIGNQHPTSPLTQSLTSTSPLTQSLTSTSSLTTAATSSATSSLTNSLTNSMKRMQIQANGNLSPSQEGPLSTLVDQLAANLSPDQQAMLIQMLQQTQSPKQTDEEIEAAWAIPQEPQAKTEGTPTSPTINYEGTDPSTLRGGLRKLYFSSLPFIPPPSPLPQSATSSLSLSLFPLLCSKFYPMF